MSAATGESEQSRWGEWRSHGPPGCRLSWPEDSGLWLAWTLIVVGLFWPFLNGQLLVGYRDSVQFYWPMFRWADSVWAAGECPLWNPFEGLGRGHLAEGVSSVFYPGKLLFWVRWFSFEARYGGYQALHVWLAGLGAGWLAGRWGADWSGRALALLSFGLAGPVLFAATNVVYLVSAAWLPWGLGAVSFWRESAGRVAAVRGTAAVAALMILGGDPQMAGNLLLIASASWIWWSSGAGPMRSRLRGAMVAIVAGLVTLALTLALAAVQLLPCLPLAAESERAGFHEPRSWPEWLLASCVQGELQSLDPFWLEPPPGTHRADIYEFSQPPWTIAEWIWPGSSGRPFPEWSHWVSSLPGAGRMWQPSLYQGAGAFLLAVAAATRRELRWFVLWGGLGLLAAWGWYGPVWLFNELGLATGCWRPLQGVDRAVGGVYWWLVCLVPGYSWFRYPAKLLMLTTLAIAVLAGCGWTDCCQPKLRHVPAGRRSIDWLFRCTAALSVAVLGLALFFPWSRLDGSVCGDEWFGPFRGTRFARELSLAAIQTLFVTLGSCWLLRRGGVGPVSAGPRVALLGLWAGELLLANAWLLAAVPVPSIPAVTEPMPVFWSRPEPPDEWRESSSLQRLEEVVNWEVASAFPRLHWLRGERLLNAPATIESRPWQEFLDNLNREPSPGADAPASSPEFLFDSQQVWVLSGESSPLDPAPSDPAPAARPETEPQTSSPREPGLGIRPAGRVLQRTARSLKIEVQLDRPGTVFSSDAYAAGWRVRVKQVPAGTATQRECLRVGQWLRGVSLSPGNYILDYYFLPPELPLGRALSLLGWLCLGLERLIKSVVFPQVAAVCGKK